MHDLQTAESDVGEAEEVVHEELRCTTAGGAEQPALSLGSSTPDATAAMD